MSPPHREGLTVSVGVNNEGGMKSPHSDIYVDPTRGPAAEDPPAKSRSGQLRSEGKKGKEEGLWVKRCRHFNLKTNGQVCRPCRG